VATAAAAQSCSALARAARWAPVPPPCAMRAPVRFQTAHMRTLDATVLRAAHASCEPVLAPNPNPASPGMSSRGAGGRRGPGAPPVRGRAGATAAAGAPARAARPAPRRRCPALSPPRILVQAYSCAMYPCMPALCHQGGLPSCAAAAGTAAAGKICVALPAAWTRARAALLPA